jgi:hypothetical protein
VSGGAVAQLSRIVASPAIEHAAPTSAGVVAAATDLKPVGQCANAGGNPGIGCGEDTSPAPQHHSAPGARSPQVNRPSEALIRVQSLSVPTRVGLKK